MVLCLPINGDRGDFGSENRRYVTHKFIRLIWVDIYYSYKLKRLVKIILYIELDQWITWKRNSRSTLVSDDSWEKNVVSL